MDFDSAGSRARAAGAGEMRDMTDAAALLERVRAADGRAPDGPPDPAAADLIAERDPASGELAALAWRPRGAAADPAELYVDPRFRRRGIGRRLAEALLAEPGGVWAHGTLPAAARLAATLGLRPVRELMQLRADLPVPADVAAPALPDGVAIRTFRPGLDDAEFLRVNAAAFAWHPEQGRLDQAGLDADMTLPWFDAAGFFLAVLASEPDRVLGFHWTKVHPADPPAEPQPVGEIYVLAVDPGSEVRHLGAPLTAAGLNHLAAKGLSRVMLYVEADNAPALKLYRRFGFADAAIDTVFA
jgi:mycothiol synthase